MSPDIASGVLDVLLAQETANHALDVRDNSGCTAVEYARRQAEDSRRASDTQTDLVEAAQRLERCSLLDAYCANRKQGST